MPEQYGAPDEKLMRAATGDTERPGSDVRPHIVLSRAAHQRGRTLGSDSLTSSTQEQPDESATPGPRGDGRARGLRQVRRWSNWTAAALIAATVVTTGYFARASHPAAAAASAGTGRPGPGSRERRRAPHQPCVSVPVATSGGSGVTRQTVVRSCGTGIQRPRRDHHGPHARRRRIPDGVSRSATPGTRLTCPAPGVPRPDLAAWVRGELAGCGTDGRAALGTTARVAAWPPEDLDLALAAVDTELERLDRQASRFRDDSELSRIHREPGPVHQLSPGLAEAISVALAAARWTGGLVDPTVGGALIALGYDRDFAAIVRPWRRPGSGRRAAPGAGGPVRRPAGGR